MTKLVMTALLLAAAFSAAPAATEPVLAEDAKLSLTYYWLPG